MQTLAERTGFNSDHANVEDMPQSFEDALRLISQQQKEIIGLKDRLLHDQKLTELYTNPVLERRLEQYIDRGDAFGFIFIDLNKFGLVNKDINHKVGEQTLHEFSDLLTGAFRREKDELDFLAQEGNDPIVRGRIGGDEFGIIVDLSDNKRRGNDVNAKMDRVVKYLEELSAKFVAERPSLAALGFGVAVGPAVWNPNNPVDTRTLYLQAEQAMKEAKETAEEEVAASTNRSLGASALLKSD